MRAAEPDQAAVERQHRGGVGGLPGDVAGRRVGRHPQPWPVAREPAVRCVAPRHRGAGLIAIPPRRDRAGDGPAAAGRRIDDLGPRNRHVGQPDLLAVIEEGRAAQRQLEDRGSLGDGVGDAGRRVIGEARHVTGLVVVRQHDRRPAALAEDRLAFGRRRCECVAPPRLLDEVEVEDEVALV